MFDGIVVDIIAVVGIIPFIADAMFNMPPLPDRGFAVFPFRVIHPVGYMQTIATGLRYPAFDEIPVGGVVGVTRQEFPQAMQVVGQ